MNRVLTEQNKAAIGLQGGANASKFNNRDDPANQALMNVTKPNPYVIIK